MLWYVTLRDVTFYVGTKRNETNDDGFFVCGCGCQHDTSDMETPSLYSSPHIQVYYVIGYTTFLIAMVRMHMTNKKLLFPEYRDRSAFYLVYKMIRYCMFFQLLFYSVMGNYFFLGGWDHMLSKPGIVSATNKDSITITRGTALKDVIWFNSGSWLIAFYILCLSYATVVQTEDWDYNAVPQDLIYALLFAGPAAFMAVMAFIVPIILNPYVLGWPFHPGPCSCFSPEKENPKAVPEAYRDHNGKVVDLGTFMHKTDPSTALNHEMGRLHAKPDLEIGSLATRDVGGMAVYNNTPDKSLGRQIPVQNQTITLDWNDDPRIPFGRNSTDPPIRKGRRPPPSPPPEQSMMMRASSRPPLTASERRVEGRNHQSKDQMQKAMI